MGRFDALTQLDKKPGEPTKKEVLPSSTTPPVQKTDLPANLQTSKDVSMQASKPANTQTRLHANPQTGLPVFIEKYSTYLTPDCKRGLAAKRKEKERQLQSVIASTEQIPIQQANIAEQ